MGRNYQAVSTPKQIITVTLTLDLHTLRAIFLACSIRCCTGEAFALLSCRLVA